MAMKGSHPPTLVMLVFLGALAVLLGSKGSSPAFAAAFVPTKATPRRIDASPWEPRTKTTTTTTTTTTPVGTTTPVRRASFNDNDENIKFGMAQRLDSGKAFVVGAVVGSFAGAIPVALHQLVLSPLFSLPGDAGLAQFEFDNDAAGLLTGLFAIVYRYGLREDTSNAQLNQGLIAAFAVTRTLSRITLPSYCTALVLHCGPPLGYVDWNVLMQVAVNGAESVAMYGATAWALDTCMERGWISRFPG